MRVPGAADLELVRRWLADPAGEAFAGGPGMVDGVAGRSSAESWVGLDSDMTPVSFMLQDVAINIRSPVATVCLRRNVSGTFARRWVRR